MVASINKHNDNDNKRVVNNIIMMVMHIYLDFYELLCLFSMAVFGWRQPYERKIT